MSAPDEAIARRLALRFASVLGAELPAFTERLLAEEPSEEAQFRMGDPSIVLGYAGFLVALSTLAWNAYLQRAQGREVAALREDVSFLKGALVAELNRTAPQGRPGAERLRELMVEVAVEVTLAGALGSEAVRAGPLLKHEEILVLYEAVVSAQLAGSRAALLVGIDAGFVAGLPSAERHGEQILCDLGELNEVGSLEDGSVPLALWLANAVTLAGPRREVAVFREARARVGKTGKE